MGSRNTSLKFEITPGALLPLTAIYAIAVVRFGARPGVIGATLFVLSLLAHEAGHVALAWIMDAHVKAIGFCAKGAYIRREDTHDFSEVLIAAAGPAVNLLLAAFLWNGQGVLSWLMQLNLILGLANLIPIKGTDGRRILQTLFPSFKPAAGASSL
jgi:Zn-dependent protease